MPARCPSCGERVGGEQARCPACDARLGDAGYLVPIEVVEVDPVLDSGESVVSTPRRNRAVLVTGGLALVAAAAAVVLVVSNRSDPDRDPVVVPSGFGTAAPLPGGPAEEPSLRWQAGVYGCARDNYMSAAAEIAGVVVTVAVRPVADEDADPGLEISGRDPSDGTLEWSRRVRVGRVVLGLEAVDDRALLRTDAGADLFNARTGVPTSQLRDRSVDQVLLWRGAVLVHHQDERLSLHDGASLLEYAQFRAPDFYVLGDLVVTRRLDVIGGYALATGEQRWVTTVEGARLLAGFDDRVVVVDEHDGLTALDVASGRARWTRSDLGRASAVEPVGSDRLFVQSGERVLVLDRSGDDVIDRAYDTDLVVPLPARETRVVVDDGSGFEVRSLDLDEVVARIDSPTRLFGQSATHLYTGEGGRLVARSLGDGRQAWSVPIPTGTCEAIPVGDAVLVVSDENGIELYR